MFSQSPGPCVFCGHYQTIAKLNCDLHPVCEFCIDTDGFDYACSVCVPQTAIPQTNHFDKLPDEMILEILKPMSPAALFQFMQTDRKMCRLVKDEIRRNRHCTVCTIPGKQIELRYAQAQQVFVCPTCDPRAKCFKCKKLKTSETVFIGNICWSCNNTALRL